MHMYTYAHTESKDKTQKEFSSKSENPTQVSPIGSFQEQVWKSESQILYPKINPNSSVQTGLQKTKIIPT